MLSQCLSYFLNLLPASLSGFHIYQQFYLIVIEQFTSGTHVYLSVTLLFSLCVFLHTQNKTSGSNFDMVKSATKSVVTTHTLLPGTLDI